MSRKRNDRYGRNNGRQALLRRMIGEELVSVLLFTLPVLVGGAMTGVAVAVALLLQLDVALTASCRE